MVKKVKGAAPKRKYRGIPDRDRISITLARFSPLAHGLPMTPISDLADRYKRDPSVISRAIKDAFEDGLVEVVEVQRRAPEPKRVHTLERQLQERYWKLLTVIVVEPPYMPEPEAGPEALAQWDDDVHRSLGEALARSFTTGITPFRNGEAIGFGSGRGVYSVVAALRFHPPLRVEEIKLMSLTGSLLPSNHARMLNAALDADFHVSLFGLSIEGVVHSQMAIHAITSKDDQQLASWRGLTCLDEARWERQKPTHALMGAGVLGPGHRMYEAAQPDRMAAEEDTVLGPILRRDANGQSGVLARLVDLCREASQPDQRYYAVGDVCNHLFFVPPKGGATSQREAIEKLTTAINQKLLNVTRKQLGEIDHVILCAGTTKKAWTIHQLLCGEMESADPALPKTRIRTLCTDSATAQELLGFPMPKPKAQQG